MHDTAVITAISEKEIIVIPLIKDACLSCKEGCAKRGHPFSVVNSKNLPIKKGSIVKIASSRKSEISQGLFSLLFPIFCATVGYFVTTPTANALHITDSEGLHAGFVLLGLSLSAVFVFLLSRNKIQLSKPEISEIC